MDKLIHFFKHGCLFSIAKCTVLFAPLLAAAVLSERAYGQLEWWLALSLTLGPVLAMGAPVVVAYGTVGDKLKSNVSFATIFILSVGSCLVVLAMFFRSISSDWEEGWYGLVVLQTALVCFQATLAARLKGLGKGAWASLIESFLYTSLFSALILASLGFDFHAVYGSVLACSTVLAACGIFWFAPPLDRDTLTRQGYGEFLKLAMPFMVGGSLMAGFMAAPRVLLGINGTPENVAEFALAFRWLSIAIAAHQFIHTLFFPKIFGDVDFRKREKLLAVSVTIVGMVVIFEIVFLHMAHFLNLGLPLPSDFALLLPISIAMVLWATTASLEGALFRIGAVGKQTRSVLLGLVTMLGISAFFVYPGVHSAKSMGYAWVGGMVVIIISQFLSLRALGECSLRLVVLSAVICIVVGSSIELIDAT